MFAAPLELKNAVFCSRATLLSFAIDLDLATLVALSENFLSASLLQQCLGVVEMIVAEFQMALMF